MFQKSWTSPSVELMPSTSAQVPVPTTPSTTTNMSTLNAAHLLRLQWGQCSGHLL